MNTTIDASNAATRAREAIEIVCTGNLSRVADHYSPDFVDHVNDMTFHGHEGARESVGLYLAIFKDMSINVEEQVTEGNRVASRWTLHGRYRGRAVEMRGIVISRLDEQGMVLEDYGYSDTLSLLRQLGVLRTFALAGEVLSQRIKLPKAESSRCWSSACRREQARS
jgi:hypothetical protein